MKQNRKQPNFKASIYHIVKIWYKGGVETFINDLCDERLNKEVLVGSDIQSFKLMFFKKNISKSDIICFHTPLYFLSFFYVLLSGFKAKVIIHNDLKLLYTPLKKIIAYPWIFFLLLCGVKVIYFNPGNAFLSEWSSNALQGRHLDHFPEEKEISLHDGPKNILFVGRFHHSKGFEKAISIISKLNGEFDFKVFGDFPKEVIDEYTTKNINFYGFRKALNEVYIENSILLICSDYESGPLVAFEALSFGLPVLTTQVGIFQEISISSKFDFLTIYETEKSAIDFLEEFLNTEEFCTDNNLNFLKEKLMSKKDFIDKFFLEKTL